MSRHKGIVLGNEDEDDKIRQKSFNCVVSVANICWLDQWSFSRRVVLIIIPQVYQEILGFRALNWGNQSRTVMEKIEHKIVSVNGIKMHVAELGKGPLVLFLHGFPELWYSWRHQILFMAERGYRAVAPDLRGYGNTIGLPTDDVSKFTVFHIVGDLIELLQAIAPDADKVFVVGHDWVLMLLGICPCLGLIRLRLWSIWVLLIFLGIQKCSLWRLWGVCMEMISMFADSRFIHFFLLSLCEFL